MPDMNLVINGLAHHKLIVAGTGLVDPGRNLIKILVRFLLESYKILTRFLQDSYRILTGFLQGFYYVSFQIL